VPQTAATHRPMKSTVPLLGFVVLLMSCTSERGFYRFESREFVPLAEIPVRKDLIGSWRSNDGRQLVLRPDGKFSAGKMGGGCWDVEGRKLLLRSACVNYGAQKDSVILALAEMTYECTFNVSGRLVLKDCAEAGDYWRETEPKDRPPVRR
jgi:hypothetical protein